MDYTEDILKYLSARTEFADVRYMHSTTESYSYRNGQFDGQYRSDGSGYAVRCVNNSIAMSFFNDTNFQSIKNKLDSLVDTSRKGGKHKIDMSGGVKTSWKQLGRKKVVDISDEYKIEFIKDMDRIMGESSASVRFSNIMDTTVSESYANSSGSSISGEYSRIYFAYMAGISESGSFEESSEEYGSTSGYEFTIFYQICLLPNVFFIKSCIIDIPFCKVLHINTVFHAFYQLFWRLITWLYICGAHSCQGFHIPVR